MAKKYSELKDACWKGYEAIGTKKKNGKEVPNCVPKNEEQDIEERNKENATKRKNMDASRGARYKLNNPVPKAGAQHKTGVAHNKAIGRALRSEEKDAGEYDYEGAMAKTALQTICRNAEDMMEMLKDDENLPEWVQAKIVKAEDYMSSVREYMQSVKELGESFVAESHFKVGEKVKCKDSGMTGKVVAKDPSEKGKYYTVKTDSGKTMKYSPDELKSLSEAVITEKKVTVEKNGKKRNIWDAELRSYLQMGWKQVMEEKKKSFKDFVK